ncbi:50S ribosomal protein L18 [Candidatus Pacearchaeota archaeon]|jgi:large subunit ribosomal protein L18|nr:50S ribosomal protein L18 [Candidatus Pacearchaeota archaeon]|tara:strand:- start:3131 stop:3628 length:498 start_codon:yes stop_codon:yes gene_type:complete
MKTLKRRRKENKTDYLKRIKLLKNNSPRITFRKTNKYVISQYITSKQAQDKIKIGVNSKQLIKYGWPKEFEGSLKSIPASYLTGFLIGKTILKEKLETPTIDFGMIRPLHKTRIYAFLKGLIDSGIEIKHKKDIFPDEEKIKGKYMKKDFSQIFNEIKLKIEKEQ